jgi:hypothetical protein
MVDAAEGVAHRLDEVTLCARFVSVSHPISHVSLLILAMLVYEEYLREEENDCSYSFA